MSALSGIDIALWDLKGTQYCATRLAGGTDGLFYSTTSECPSV